MRFHLKEFNVAKEQHAVQPPSYSNNSTDFLKTPLDNSSNVLGSGVPPLQHQSRSYPTGQPHLCRTPSVSSQSSLDSSASRQVIEKISFIFNNKKT